MKRRRTTGSDPKGESRLRGRLRSLRRLGLFATRLSYLLPGVAAAACLVVMASGGPLWVALATLVAAAAGIAVWKRLWLPVGSAVLVIIVSGWWALRSPSNERDWVEEASILPTLHVHGDELRIENLRNFRRSPDGAFEPRWEERTYDLDKLRAVELMIEPFAITDAVAHTMLGFDFGEDGRFVLSIEARRERGETYGPLAGALRQFELIYLFIDERDSLTSRAYRGARLYVYPTRLNPELRRAFLRDMCEAANELHDQPRFYHIIEHNCTTVWLKHLAGVVDESVFFNPIIILNGRIGQLLYDAGGIDTDLSYDEARERFRVDELVLEHAEAEDFSALIRAGQAPGS